MPATFRTQLKKVRGLGSAMGGPGTDHFWMQRMTAVSNIFATGFLVYAALILVGASRADVKTFFVNPIHAILGILLVISATIHMRLGMQVIIEEYVPRGLKVPCMFLNTFLSMIIAVACVLALIKLNLGV
jgi:succinate dehydrogenase / fumarate reductase, membrane anchor subunit